MKNLLLPSLGCEEKSKNGNGKRLIRIPGKLQKRYD